MSLTAEQKAKLAANQREDRPSDKDFENAGDFLLPEGHYLVQISDVNLDEYNGEKYSCDQLVFDAEIIEPKQFAGKIVKFNKINLYVKGEPEWARNKRLAFLVSSGLVKKGDSAAVAAFDWSKLEGQKFVQEIEHNHYEKEGVKKVNSRGKGFSMGFKPANVWGTLSAPPPSNSSGGSVAAGAQKPASAQSRKPANAAAATAGAVASATAGKTADDYADDL